MHHKRPGDRVGRYVVEAPLGIGGMGEVYEARDTRLGRRIALKLLRDDAGSAATQRLLREAQAAAALEHPNAVVIYDVGEADDEMFIAMELVRGRPLRSFIGDASVPAARKLRWLIDVARALGAAHREGLIHRDVKPDNIVIRDDNTAKVLDFGIARKERAPQHSSEKAAKSDRGGRDLSTITADGFIVGTPRYWAPEQLRSEPVDGRTDQFAWGVTAYELLAGRPPWIDEQPVTLLSRILTSDPPPLLSSAPDTPEEVADAIARSLRKRPDDRFPTIDDAADALEPFAEAPVTRGRRITPETFAAASADAVTGARAAPSETSLVNHRTSTGDAPRRARLRPGAMRRLALVGALAACSIGAAAAAGAALFRAPSVAVPGSAAPAAAAPLVVDTLACKEASLQGRGALPDLAPAIGVGACARLAVELGVDWTVTDAAHRVDVEARLDGGAAMVKLSVGGRAASASGATPLDAINAAVAALAKQLTPRPMTQAEIAAWGTKDEAGARRVERAMRRIELDFAPDDQAVAKELLTTDPDSALTYFIAEMVELGGTDKRGSWTKRAIELESTIPEARAKVVRVRFAKEKQDRAEVLRLLRQAYADAPDDPLVMTSYGINAIRLGAEDEGFAVINRLYARAPSRGAWASYVVIDESPTRDPERERALVDRVRTILPESAAWQKCVRSAVRSGDIDEARRRLALGLNIGTTGSTLGSYYAETARAWVELAAFEPKAARELASKLLGEARPLFVMTGADLTIASYILEGRLDDAAAAELRELDRYKASPDAARALDFAVIDMRRRRLLGRPPPTSERLAWAREIIRETEVTSNDRLASARAELALAEGAAQPKNTKVIAERALAELDSYIKEQARDDRTRRDSLRVATVPLARVARGDADAAARWLDSDRIQTPAHRAAALDAALALEAIGKTAEAEKAYLIAQDPVGIDHSALTIIAARIRLAELYRSQKRVEEAEKLDAVIDRLWTGADPGVRETLRSLR